MRSPTRASVLLLAGAITFFASSYARATASGFDLVAAARSKLGPSPAKSVPLLLPSSLAFANDAWRRAHPISASGSRDARVWSLVLEDAPDCNGANACFVASFEGRADTTLPSEPNVTLASGDRAYYEPRSCEGSCAPATLEFVHAGSHYVWQMKDEQLACAATMTALANAAIAAGPR